MASINCNYITIGKTYRNDISYNKNKSQESNGFKHVFDGLMNNLGFHEDKKDIQQDNKKIPGCSINYSDIAAANGKTEEELLENAKAQEQFKLDIKRIAKLMGVPTAFVMAAVGNLKIDPKNLNFKIESNADLAVNDISQYFGISPMTMLAIFDKLKIDPGDLEYKEEKGKIIGKLKDFFHLNMEQEKELTKIIEKYATKSKPK